ncbi:MAG TPA: hypothetical protein VHQ42_04400 [Candidatus Limnocylindria bacterium]|nr:hypothetical protein [Candidatus Limnocylindria bacterium]
MTAMLEITEPARQLIREAWRRGHVLVVSAPWSEYGWSGALVAAWRSIGDEVGLAGCIRVGDGDWVYLRSDLLPVIRRRRVRLELHSILGFWKGIAVRDLEPVAIVSDDGLRWPRPRRGG